MRESEYQYELIAKLYDRLPGCVVVKNDAAHLQGIPDLLVLYKHHWAMLEVKRSADAPERPNQHYYVELLDGMSFSRFIYPENEEEILDALQSSFGVARQARLFESE